MYRAAKHSAVVKLLLAQAMRSELVGVGFQDFSVVQDQLLEFFVL
jgi:hypothetical protein